MTELLPCPFCGGEAEVYYDDEFVNCTVCFASVELWGLGNSSAAWNRRSQSIQNSDRTLKPCPLCGDMAYRCEFGIENKYFIECDDNEDENERRRCKCETGLCDTPKEAEDAWNERVDR